MKSELCWIHSIVFEVGLQYWIECHGEAVAVRREDQSLHVAVSTMLNVNAVNKQTMLDCCIPYTMSDSVVCGS